MYLINLNHNFNYETENLLRLFFPEKIVQTDEAPEREDYILTELDGGKITVRLCLTVIFHSLSSCSIYFSRFAFPFAIESIQSSQPSNSIPRFPA